jgi:hypothetical protein
MDERARRCGGRPIDRLPHSTTIPPVPADEPDDPRPDDRVPLNRPGIRRHKRRPVARDARELRHVLPASPDAAEEMPGAERRARQRPPRRADLASPASQAAYRRMMEALKRADVAFLVGGAYAFTPFTGIPRSTKDFDVFVAKSDIARALQVLEAAGFRTELTFPHWLAKGYWGNDFIDLIFGSGNGVAPVDARWFDNAPTGTVLGLEVRLAPAEEMLWSKAFVMERERYDGGDVIHLLRARADKLDWHRVLDRFGAHWRVLLANLVLFGFVYPGERTRVPAWVMETLMERLRAELTNDADVGRLCNGTMLSRQQYLPDVLEWGYADGRLAPLGGMTAEEIADWTAAIGVKR